MISKSCAKDEGSVLRPGFVHTSGGLVYKHLSDKLSLHIRSMFTHLRLSHCGIVRQMSSWDLGRIALRSTCGLAVVYLPR